MTRILIADDHTLVREGLKQILSATPELEVVAEAMDGDQALAHVRSTEFDLALLDFVRFMAGWGMWGNAFWGQQKARVTLAALGLPAKGTCNA